MEDFRRSHWLICGRFVEGSLHMIGQRKLNIRFPGARARNLKAYLPVVVICAIFSVNMENPFSKYR